jgi:hypothetical protein
VSRRLAAKRGVRRPFAQAYSSGDGRPPSPTNRESWHDGPVEPRTATFADHSNLSPNYTTDEVLRNPTLGRKIDVLVDQVENWIIAPAEALLSMPHAQRAVLMIATSYFELIACYLAGRESEGESKAYFRAGLLTVFPEIKEHARQTKEWLSLRDKPVPVPANFVEITVKETCESVYRDLRCGLFHIGLLRPRILPTSGPAVCCIFDSRNWKVMSILVDPTLFLERIKAHFRRYVDTLRRRESVEAGNYERLWNARFLAAQSTIH